MNAETFLDVGPQRKFAEDFLQGDAAGSAEDFLQGDAADAGGTPGASARPPAETEDRLEPLSEARKRSWHNEVAAGMMNLREFNDWLKGGLRNPAKGLIPLQEIAPSAQTAQDAIDFLGAFPSEDDSRTPAERADEMARPQQAPGKAAQAIAGGIKVGLGIPESMTSPAALATMGAGPAVAKAASLAFLADTVRNTPEAARAAGEASENGNTQQQVEALGGLALNFLMGPSMALHAKGERGEVKGESRQAEGPKVVSEFGGDVAPEGMSGSRIGSQPIGETVSETAGTLAAQLDRVATGERKAMVMKTAPAELPPGLKTLQVGEDVFVYHPDRISPESIKAAVAENRVGEILGYGVAEKPAAGEPAIALTQRDAAGTPTADVITTQENGPKVVQALSENARPGDTLEARAPQEVLAERVVGLDAEAQSRKDAEKAKRTSKVIDRTREAGDRPWDIIDEIEAQLGGKINLGSAKDLQEDFSPTGAARKLFSGDGSHSMDEVRQAVEGAGWKFDSDEAVQDAITTAAEARKSFKQRQAAEARQLALEEEQTVRFERETKRQGKDKQSVLPEELNDGDSFAVKGERFKVRLEFDDNGEVIGTHLEGGDQFGRQRVEPGRVLQVDRGSVKKNPNATEWITGSAADEWATNVIAEGQKRLSSGLDPELLAAYSIKGAAMLERGVRSVAKWSAAMVKEFGEAIRPHLKAILKESRRHVRSSQREERYQLKEEPGNPELWHITDEELAGRMAELQRDPEGNARELADLNREYMQREPLAKQKEARQGAGNGTAETDLPGREQRGAARGRERADTGEPERTGSGAGDAASTVSSAGAEALPKDRKEFLNPFRNDDHAQRVADGLYDEWQRVSAELKQWETELQLWGPGTRGHARAIAEARYLAGRVDALEDFYRHFQSKEVKQKQRPRIEDQLDLFKIDTKGQLHAFGLIPEAWNTLIDLVKVGIQAGRAVGEAVEFAIGKIKEQFPENAFEEQQARDFLMGKFDAPLRQYGEKVLGNEGVSPDVQTAVREYNYVPRSNESDSQAAQRIVAEQGVDGAIRAFQDDGNAMPGAVRSILGDHLVQTLAEQQRMAAATGNKALSDELATKQVQVIEHELGRSTDIAQALQAMRRYGLMSAAGMVKHAMRTIQGAGQHVVETVRPVVDAIRTELERGNKDAIEGVAADPAVNEAARTAVNEAIETSPATHTGVVMEVLGEWAKSPTIMADLKSRLHGKLEALLKLPKETRAADVKARLAALMSETMDRVMSIANGHYQGAEPGKTLAQKIEQRTGLSEKHAKDIAGALDRQFAAMVEKAKKKLKARIAMQRARQLEGVARAETNPVDAEIRRQLKAMNLKLGEVLRRPDAGEVGKTIGERVVKESGLTGEAADRLLEVLNKRFAELAAAAKRKRLEQLGHDIKVPRQVKAAYEKLIEASGLGGFSNEVLYRLVKEKLGLPAWTPELGAEIAKRANAIEKLPEGFQRQRAVVDMLNFIERTKGLKWYDLPMGFWYANILSGITTHLKNMISTGLNTATHVGINMVLNPTATPQILTALGRGLLKGGADAVDVLRTGISTGTRLQALEASRALELKKFEGWAYPMNAWKYVFRFMGAEDMLFFKPAEEMKAALLSRQVAKREGLSGPALRARTNELLANVEAKRVAAEAKARGEGLRGLDLRRRTSEILEQERPAAFRESARDYALRVTFNSKPYGLVGAIAQGLNLMRSKYPVMNTVVPFVNIVGNVVNEGLNYLPPVGLTRAIYGHMTGTLEGKPLADRALLHEQYAKAFLGTAALTGLATLAANYLQDEDPKFAVYGAGPSSPAAKNELRAIGWVPYSFKVGNRYIPYGTSPGAILFATLGNYHDALRYKHLDNTDLLNRVAFAMTTSGKVITEQSFLSGIADVFQMVDREGATRSAESAARYVARTAAGMAIPNALRQVDQVFDPTVYDARTVEALVINQVPFARRQNHPALNALGEPVQRFVSDPFLSKARSDELLQVLASKQAWVPMPDRQTIVGDRKRGPDHFRVLDEDEFYEFVQTSGAAIRSRLEAQLPRLELMGAAEAKAYVDKIAEQERKRAKRAFPR